MAKLSYEELSIEEKFCNCCKKLKPVTDFYLCDTDRMKDGLQNFCKECTNLKRKLKASGVINMDLAIAEYYGFKYCTGCEEYLPLSYFWNGGESDGLQHYCKKCYGKFPSRGGSGLRDGIDNKSRVNSSRVSRVVNKSSISDIDLVVNPVIKLKSLLSLYSLDSKDFFYLIDFYNSCSDYSKDLARKIL